LRKTSNKAYNTMVKQLVYPSV